MLWTGPVGWSGWSLADSHDISVVALTRYADACPQDLHKDCPFARESGNLRICKRECRTVNANMLRPASREVGRSEFDAGQALLIAQASAPAPTVEWSTTALLVNVERVVNTRPYRLDGSLDLSRLVDGTNAFAYLGQRGIDPKSLLVHGFGRQLLLTIDVVLGAAEMENESLKDINRHLGALQALRKETLDSSSGSTGIQLSKPFRTGLRAWLSFAEMEDLLRWVPPADLGDLDPTEEAEASEFLWLAERFTKTYLDDWSQASLKLEYRYTHEKWQPGAFPVELLSERQVPPVKVSEELAARVVHGRRGDPAAVSALVERALEAIDNKKRDLAAAIFTTARTLDPDDNHIANNLAFCLLPDRPDEALEILIGVRARTEMNLLPIANSVAALMRLGETSEALRVAEEAAAIGLEAGATAWFWVFPIQDDPVTQKIQAGQYICDLAVIAASERMDSIAVEIWEHRRSALQ